MTESVLDIMSGGTKAPGAFNKYSQIGDTVSGVIESVEVWDVRNFNTGQPETWDDGSVQKQLRILFQADAGTWTPQGEDDTGMRAHYVKAWNPHLKSLRDGLAAVGEKEPKPGGWISIRYDHDQQNKSGYDTKIYVYQYQPPATEAANLLGGGQQQPAQQPQAQQSQQFSQQQTPVPPVANVHTQQGQVNPQTGEIVGQTAPVQPVPAQAQQPAPQPQAAQQAQPVQDPWTGQPAQQQPQAQPQQPQAAPQAGPAPGAGMDAAIIKLVQANLPDQTILETLGAQGVTADQIAQVRASLGQ